MQKRLWGMFYIVIFLLVLCSCQADGHKESAPDAVSSTRINSDERLLVVANRERIEDELEFAEEVIKMCKENSFKTILFSSTPASLNMTVYLWKEDIEDGNPVMEIKYIPKERNMGYDIKDSPDKFDLYINGEIVQP